MARGMVGLAIQIRDALAAAKKGIPATLGIMSGEDYVKINGTTYPAHLAVDLDVISGDPVWCQVTDGGGGAVIVGN